MRTFIDWIENCNRLQLVWFGICSSDHLLSSARRPKTCSWKRIRVSDFVTCDSLSFVCLIVVWVDSEKNVALQSRLMPAGGRSRFAWNDNELVACLSWLASPPRDWFIRRNQGRWWISLILAPASDGSWDWLTHWMSSSTFDESAILMPGR